MTTWFQGKSQVCLGIWQRNKHFRFFAGCWTSQQTANCPTMWPVLTSYSKLTPRHPILALKQNKTKQNKQKNKQTKTRQASSKTGQPLGNQFSNQPCHSRYFHCGVQRLAQTRTPLGEQCLLHNIFMKAVNWNTCTSLDGAGQRKPENWCTVSLVRDVELAVQGWKSIRGVSYMSTNMSDTSRQTVPRHGQGTATHHSE